ncbi:MAG: flagellar export chaperone FliS [Gammaproteobacteria bacterium]|nr:flagellar export chaperone FliS [Pseudomonadales bacterium]MCP5349015.1 flagellar export chaperone FliS [Pseudomonadales bacterium]
MQDLYGVNHYQKIEVETRVSSSNPHSLVTMLFDGLLEKLARATGAIARGNVAEKGQALSASIKIVDGLRASLDYEKGGEIAANLGAMYDYIERRLLEANTQSSSEIVAEVASLIKQIKSGWDAIPTESRGA